MARGPSKVEKIYLKVETWRTNHCRTYLCTADESNAGTLLACDYGRFGDFFDVPIAQISKVTMLKTRSNRTMISISSRQYLQIVYVVGFSQNDNILS